MKKKENFGNWWKKWLEQQFGCKLFNPSGSPAATWSTPKEWLLRKRDFLLVWNYQQDRIDNIIMVCEQYSRNPNSMGARQAFLNMVEFETSSNKQ